MLKVSEKLQVSNLICNYDDKVTSLEGEISSIIPTYKSLLYEVQEKLISPLITSNKTHVETQTVEQEKKSKDFSKIQYGRPIHSVYPSPDGRLVNFKIVKIFPITLPSNFELFSSSVKFMCPLLDDEIWILSV